MKSEEPEVNLLSDDPADHDEFGSHQRIADAIHKLIDKKDSGGKSICISGNRGSGKSTIVKLLEKTLSKNQNKNESNKYHFFVFDTWTHQGDPLKRAFLEDYIHSLFKNKYLSESDSDKYKKMAAGKITKTVTKGNKTLTKKGAAFAITSFFSAFGLSCFIVFLSELFDFTWIIWPFLAFSFILFILPFAVAIYYKCKGEKSLSQLFEKENEEDIVSETIITSSPSSIEFKHYFDLLTKMAFNESSINIIIVVDNLDRLEPEKAVEFWSSLRIFFDHNVDDPPSWFNNFWLIIPFSGDVIRGYWRKEVLSGLKSDEDGLENAQSFIDKTFQVVFSIKEPVLSSWEDFLKEKFKYALHHKSEDVETVLRIFTFFKESTGLRINPREIIVYINNIVALYLQWHDDIPIAIQAFYALCIDNITKPYEQLPGLKMLGKLCENDDNKEYLVRRLLGERAEEFLSALYFNVEVKKALQVLLENPITEALISGNENKLLEISDAYGFGCILARVISQKARSWVDKDPLYITNSAYALEYLEDRDELKKYHLWDHLAAAAAAVEQWPSLDRKLAEALILLVDKVQER